MKCGDLYNNIVFWWSQNGGETLFSILEWIGQYRKGEPESRLLMMRPSNYWSRGCVDRMKD